MNETTLGFEVSLNGRRVAAAVNKGVLSVILTNRCMPDNDISLDVGGLETDQHLSSKWMDETGLKEGDEIVVTIKKIDQVSDPLKIKQRDPVEQRNKMLETYHQLKSRLEKEGLI